MYVIECPYATTSDFGSSTVAMSIRISSIAADLFALVVTLRQTHMAFDLRRRTITQILLDALTKAGSTDPSKLNTAIGQTDKTYTLGPIKFGANHADAIPAIMMQWQNGHSVQVYPKGSGSNIESPIPGLS